MFYVLACKLSGVESREAGRPPLPPHWGAGEGQQAVMEPPVWHGSPPTVSACGPAVGLTLRGAALAFANHTGVGCFRPVFIGPIGRAAAEPVALEELCLYTGGTSHLGVNLSHHSAPPQGGVSVSYAVLRYLPGHPDDAGEVAAGPLAEPRHVVANTFPKHPCLLDYSSAACSGATSGSVILPVPACLPLSTRRCALLRTPS